MKFQLTYLIFIGLASTYLTLSCSKKLSTDKNNSHFECGEELSGRYFKIKSNDNTSTLDGEDFKVVAINRETKTPLYISSTPKGCITENMLEEASSVLIRKNNKKVAKINLTYPPWGKKIDLIDTPSKYPEAKCGMKNIISGTLNPKNFLDFNNVDWLEFYYVSGKLKKKNEDKEVVSFEKVPLIYGGKWDISNIEEGLYSLEINVIDEVRGVPQRVIECEIDTEKHELYVTPGDKIKEYRKYFGKQYAVVEEDKEGRPYTVDFYEGEIKNIDIYYCLQQIRNPANEGNLDVECDPSKTYKYKDQEKGIPLEEGFWNLVYKYSKGEITTEWTSQRIMVKKVCKGVFHNSKEIKERGCTDIQGSIHIKGRDILDIEDDLATVSTIDSHLTVEETNLSSLSMPNLVYVSILDISNNVKLHSLSLDQFERVGVDLTIADTALEDFSAFSNLTTIGASLSISGNNKIKDLSSFSKLSFIGKDLRIDGNDKLEDISVFSSLNNFRGSLDISYNSVMTHISKLSNITSLKSLDISHNVNLEEISAFSNLIDIEDGLSISHNMKLRDISGLAALNSIGGGLSISDTKLKDLSAFSNLTSVGLINISYNSILEKLIGFSNIGTVSQLMIYMNTDLESLSALSNLQSVTRLVSVSGNQIKDMSGLSGLRTIGGDFSISGIEILDISDLSNITDIMGELRIEAGAINRQENSCPTRETNPNLKEKIHNFCLIGIIHRLSKLK